MAKNTNNLPYFKGGSINKNSPDKEKQSKQQYFLANFLLRKFRPRIKEKFPQHYLVQPIPCKTLEFIKEKSKKYPYFLRFDIRLYYPSINHQTLLEKLPEICQKILDKPPSRRFKKYLKNILPEFLSQSPYEKGLAIGSRLSWVLAGIFLLDLDLEIENIPSSSFAIAQVADDYLIFCKNKKEPENLLKNIILPKLQQLNLEVNEKKLKSGKFYQDKVSFIGFDFYSGYFTIQEDKIEEFKKKIIKLTWLTRKKPQKALVKCLNNQILGFGHYYKFASCKQGFEKLDGFIRMRLRRCLLGQKELLAKEGNLVLGNSILQNMGLKSLLDIKEKLDSKNKRKIRKTSKNKQKTGQFKKDPYWVRLEEIEFKHNQKLILNQLKELTRKINKLEKKMAQMAQITAKEKNKNMQV